MTTTTSRVDPVSGGDSRDADSSGCSPESRVTRSLLGYGVLAGPFYVVVSLVQAGLRDGFDPTRHEWSLLANGPGGWVQVANLLLTGLMVVAAAVGYRRALPVGGARRWAPRLLAVYGVGLVVAGVFKADPMYGFPVGTPDGPPATVTVPGMLHLVSAGAGFLALIAATFVLARYFRAQGRLAQAGASAATGVLFLAGFVGVASSTTTTATNLAFTGAVVLAWAWLTASSAHLYQHAS